MKIDKYSNKIEFLYNTINKYRDSFDKNNESPQYINFKVQEYMDFITLHYNPLIDVYINSNIVELNTVQNLFEIINDYTAMLLSYTEYINNVFNDTVLQYNEILLPLISNISSSVNTALESDTSTVEKFDDPPYTDIYSVTFKNKYMELTHDTTVNSSTNHTVEVLNSNGLPGDFRRASVKDNKIIFNSESKITSNVRNVLNEKEHFEYELLYVDRDTYKKVGGTGFCYDEGVSYISNDNKLTLELKITLSKPTDINGFSFNDCQIDSDYIIRNILVTNAIGVRYSVAKDVISNGVNIIHFNLDTIVSIELRIEQYEANECYIGHMYDSNILSNDNMYSEDYNDVMIGSITNIGLTDTNGNVNHPSSKNTNYDKNSIVSNLYNNKLQRQLLLAKRRNVSLYNFQLQNKNYRSSGYTVLQYNFASPVKSFSFNADEYIPAINEKTYIKYSVSFDNVNWHRISPIYRTGVNEYNIISVNNVLTSTNLNVKTIFSNSDIYDVYLKIELGTSNPSVSPIIKALYLEVEEFDND